MGNNTPSLYRFSLAIAFFLVASCTDQYDKYLELIDMSESARYLRAVVFPADSDSSVTVMPKIRITFNKPVELSTVLGNLRLEKKETLPDGTSTLTPITLQMEERSDKPIEGGEVLSFLTDTHLPYHKEGQEFILILGTGTKGQDGYGLKVPVRNIFTTEPYIRPLGVVSILPGSGSREIFPESRIEVSFSHPVDLDSAFKNTRLFVDDDSVPIDLDASRALVEESTNKNVVAFVPKEYFPLGSSVKVEIGKDVFRQGHENSPDLRYSLAASFVSTFTISRTSLTTPPQIISTFPRTETTGFARNGSVHVEFSQDILPTSLRSAFFLINESTQEEASVRITGTHRAFSFRPERMLEPNVLYQVHISEDVKNIRGKNLTDSYQFHFQTASSADNRPLTILRTLPITGAQDISSGASLEVLFSHAMDPNSSGAVRIDKGNIEESSFSPDGLVPATSRWISPSLLALMPNQAMDIGDYTISVIGSEAIDFRSRTLSSSLMVYFSVSGTSKEPQITVKPEAVSGGCGQGDVQIIWEVDQVASHAVSLSKDANFSFEEGLRFPSIDRGLTGSQALVLIPSLPLDALGFDEDDRLSERIDLYYRTRSRNSESQAVTSKVKKQAIFLPPVVPSLVGDAVCSGDMMEISWLKLPGYSYKLQTQQTRKGEDESQKTTWIPVVSLLDKDENYASARLPYEDYRESVTDVLWRIQAEVERGDVICAGKYSKPFKVAIRRTPEPPQNLESDPICQGGKFSLRWSLPDMSWISDKTAARVELKSRTDGLWRPVVQDSESDNTSLNEITFSLDTSKSVDWRVSYENTPCPASEYTKSTAIVAEKLSPISIVPHSSVCSGSDVVVQWLGAEGTSRISFSIGKGSSRSTYVAEADKINDQSVRIPSDYFSEDGSYLLTAVAEPYTPCTEEVSSEAQLLEVVPSPGRITLGIQESLCGSGLKIPAPFSWKSAGILSSVYTLSVYSVTSQIIQDVSSPAGAILQLKSESAVDELVIRDRSTSGIISLSAGLYGWSLQTENLSTNLKSRCVTSPLFNQDVFFVGETPPSPSLLQPDEGEKLCVGGDVVLAWTGSAEEGTSSFLVEFDTNRNGVFAEAADRDSVTTTASTLTLSLVDAGIYAWRVRYQTIQSAWSTTQNVCVSPFAESRFQIQSNPSSLTIPPASTFYGCPAILSVTGSVTLTWVGQADEYIVSFDDDKDGIWGGGGDAATQRIQVNSLVRSAAPGSYNWRVTPVTRLGALMCEGQPHPSSFSIGFRPPAPINVSPSENQGFCVPSGSATVDALLSWVSGGSPGDAYRVEYDTNSNHVFNEAGEGAIDLSTASTTWGSRPPGTYQWRVQAIRSVSGGGSTGTCKSAWLTSRFHVVPTPAVPTILFTPISECSLQGTTMKDISLAWAGVLNAGLYEGEFDVDNDGTWAEPLDDAVGSGGFEKFSLSGTSRPIPGVSGSMKWRIRAQSISGLQKCFSGWSSPVGTVTVTVTPGASVLSTTLSSCTTSGSAENISLQWKSGSSGTVVPGSTVYRVSFDSDGDGDYDASDTAPSDVIHPLLTPAGGFVNHIWSVVPLMNSNSLRWKVEERRIAGSQTCTSPSSVGSFYLTKQPPLPSALASPNICLNSSATLNWTLPLSVSQYTGLSLDVVDSADVSVASTVFPPGGGYPVITTVAASDLTSAGEYRWKLVATAGGGCSVVETASASFVVSGLAPFPITSQQPTGSAVECYAAAMVPATYDVSVSWSTPQVGYISRYEALSLSSVPPGLVLKTVSSMGGSPPLSSTTVALPVGTHTIQIKAYAEGCASGVTSSNTVSLKVIDGTLSPPSMTSSALVGQQCHNVPLLFSWSPSAGAQGYLIRSGFVANVGPPDSRSVQSVGSSITSWSNAFSMPGSYRVSVSTSGASTLSEAQACSGAPVDSSFDVQSTPQSSAFHLTDVGGSDLSGRVPKETAFVYCWPASPPSPSNLSVSWSLGFTQELTSDLYTITPTVSGISSAATQYSVGDPPTRMKMLTSVSTTMQSVFRIEPVVPSNCAPGSGIAPLSVTVEPYESGSPGTVAAISAGSPVLASLTAPLAAAAVSSPSHSAIVGLSLSSTFTKAMRLALNLYDSGAPLGISQTKIVASTGAAATALQTFLSSYFTGIGVSQPDVVVSIQIGVGLDCGNNPALYPVGAATFFEFSS